MHSSEEASAPAACNHPEHQIRFEAGHYRGELNHVMAFRGRGARSRPIRSSGLMTGDGGGAGKQKSEQ